MSLFSIRILWWIWGSMHICYFRQVPNLAKYPLETYSVDNAERGNFPEDKIKLSPP